jgi:hypothetical protein
MKYIKLFEEENYISRFKIYLEGLKNIRSAIPLQNVIEWLNDIEIDYSNWSELDMYIYYIENEDIIGDENN